MPLFDSHAHLEHPRFDADRDEVIARAHGAGVASILTCGSDLATSEAELALARRYAGVFAAVGIHAHEAATAVRQIGPDAWVVDEETMERLHALAQHPGAVAIGEIGLDYHYQFAPRAVQRLVLERQLRLASELDLPVILHNRESDTDLRAVVDAAPPGLRGMLHCFLADQAMAEWALARGLHLGVAGPITFRNVQGLPEILRRVPVERLLIETDCPYLAPHPRRGARNEPALVTYVADRLGQVLGLTADQVAQRTDANARNLLRLS